MEVIKKNCATCTVEFIYDKYHRQKFCSKKCYKASIPKRPTQQDTVEIVIKMEPKSWSQRFLEFFR